MEGNEMLAVGTDLFDRRFGELFRARLERKGYFIEPSTS
jgi:hypothetical protein